MGFFEERDKIIQTLLKKDDWHMEEVGEIFNQHMGRSSHLEALIRSSVRNGKLKTSMTDSLSGAMFFDPVTIITWAIDKQISVPEKILNWYDSQNKPKYKEALPYLDNTHPMHSEELKIAIEAWTAVLESKPGKPKTGSRKQLIEDWLKIHHSKLLKSQVDRITIMLNPDKDGGAPSAE